MKIQLTALAFSLLATAAIAQGRFWDSDFTPRDPAVSRPGHREWTWDGTDGLGLSVPAEVRVVPGGPARIVIEGPDALLAHIGVGQGKIRGDRDFHSNGEKLQVTVSGVTLHNVSIAGSGKVDLGRLDQDRLSLAIAGSGGASAEGGRLGRLALNIAGSGHADLGGMKAQRTDVHIAGSGSVSLAASETVNASLIGSGTVRLAARPATINRSIVGSGDVIVEAEK